MEIDNFFLQMGNHTANANIVRDIVLSKLYNDGVINEQQINKYSERYQVIIVKKSWFKRWKTTLKPTDNNFDYIYKFVKFEEDDDCSSDDKSVDIENK